MGWMGPNDFLNRARSDYHQWTGSSACAAKKCLHFFAAQALHDPAIWHFAFGKSQSPGRIRVRTDKLNSPPDGELFNLAGHRVRFSNFYHHCER